MKHIPKKSFGQNFLTSGAARAAIINASKLNTGDEVLEIGPGQGFLTEGLLATGAHVTAIEMDRDLIPVLEGRFITTQASPLLPSPLTPLQDLERGTTPNASAFLSGSFPQNLGEGGEGGWGGPLTLILADALLYEHDKTPYKLIANIPYYITGAILEKYLSGKNKPTLMTVLVQKEVAERIVARDGKESILSISVKIFGTPRMIQKVSAGSFHPKPKVDSAILCIENINNDYFNQFANPEYAEEFFFQMLKAAFIYKRKLLLNNLSALPLSFGEGKEKLKTIFNELHIDERERAENVTIEQWKHLFSSIYPLL